MSPRRPEHQATSPATYWRSRSGDRDGRLLERLTAVQAASLHGLRARLPPGHTPGTTSRLFEWRGRGVAVSGDAVMTEDHVRAREG